MPTVADLLVEGLLRAEVSRLFGVPGGGSNLEVLEAARARGLPFVLCHQEWAACIMAAVTGELTGHPGAVLSTLGPGVTASATGLAHARLDRSPLIYISDRHPAGVLEYATHQHLDHTAHLGPITKGSVTIGADSAAHWIAHAVQLALAEPRGPVHLDLPADVAGKSAMPVVTSVAPAPPAALDGDLIERAARMIRAARRPLVIAGLGCRAADAKWLRAFAEALPAPVLTTYKAKGAIPDPHPLALGIFTGGALEEPLVKRADLIIAFGLDTGARRAATPTSRPRSRWWGSRARSWRIWRRASWGRARGRTGTWPRWTGSGASVSPPSRSRCPAWPRTGWPR